MSVAFIKLDGFRFDLLSKLLRIDILNKNTVCPTLVLSKKKILSMFPKINITNSSIENLP